VAEGIEAVLAEKYACLLPHLDERQRRLALGADARALGRGGIRLVAGAAGVSRETVARGVAELAGDPGPPGRVRRAGGGRKRLREKHPGLVPALLALVEPGPHGDPEPPLLWTTKSTRKLAQTLTAQGLRVGSDTVAALLKEEGFSLRGAGRTTAGARHPDRDAQFRYISSRVREFADAGQPVISVDARRAPVPAHCAGAGTDPHGSHEPSADAGRAPAGCEGDTAAFAVATLRRWWDGEGHRRYPHAARLLITADAGGPDGCRARAWQRGLADFARSTGLTVTACHLPPGTSKWNRSEHWLLSRVSTHWRGWPLTSHEVVVQGIGEAVTGTGPVAPAESGPARGPVPGPVRVHAPDDAAPLPLTPHDWHGTWNYTLDPGRTARTFPKS
jgi:transposase